ASLPKLLADAGGGSLREDIDANLAEARALLPYRETGKYYLMMGYELIRAVLEEYARRFDLGGTVYFLHLDELPRLASGREALLEQAAERKLRWQAIQRLDAPEIVDSKELDHLGVAAHVEAASELTGAAMAPGVATGNARVVADPQTAGNLG